MNTGDKVWKTCSENAIKPQNYGTPIDFFAPAVEVAKLPETQRTPTEAPTTLPLSSFIKLASLSKALSVQMSSQYSD